MRERSTYCTLAFLISCSVNFEIMPIILLIYSYTKATYVVEGDPELVFRLIYLWSRISLTTIYIGKVTRLSFAFKTRRVTKIYNFLKSEMKVLVLVIMIALVLSVALMFIEKTNIVLVIESGYANCVQNFWVPLQCAEAIAYSTLFYAMKDISP